MVPLRGADEELRAVVDSIVITDLWGTRVSSWQSELCIHTYRLCESECEKDYLEGEEALPACDQWELPNQQLTGKHCLIVDGPHR